MMALIYRGFSMHLKEISGKYSICFPLKKHYCHRCSKCKTRKLKFTASFWHKRFNKKIGILKEIGWTVIIVEECQIKDKLGFRIIAIEKNLHSESTFKINQIYFL